MQSHIVKLAEELLDEVVTWVHSGMLLKGLETYDRLVAYRFDEGTIPLTITNAVEWQKATDACNSDTVFVTLTEALREVQGAYFLVHQFGGREFEDMKDAKNKLIHVEIGRSKAIAAFAQELYKRQPNDIDVTLEEFLDYIRTSIFDNLHSVNDARILSVSKRYALTEAIFEAYKLGLFPFGWDWETLWCLNPSYLDSPGPIVRAYE